MSINSVSMPVRRPVVTPSSNARPVTAAAPAANAAPVKKASRPQVKVQDQAPKKHNLYVILPAIGTGVTALGGAFMGLFACGMSDAPVSTLSTLSEAGGAGLVVGGIGAAVFFGLSAIVKSLRSK